ncbi:MAG: hypothetical protein JNJ61_20020 [Anaerolineae bacterium]|nr:hypothetical protein [Anaerolineae bacterium]
MKKLGLILLLLLAACGGGSGGAGDPGKTTESYLQAKIKGEESTIRGLLCAEMEAVLDREVNAFASVTGVELVDMVCTRDATRSTDGEAVVTCAGKIVAQYGTENTEFPLATYRLIQEDGEWKWCGEAG